MDKEQFKSIIMQQFRQPGSPILTLMLPPTTMDMSDAKESLFVAYARFYASEFELMLHVDTFFSEREEPAFQLRFEDYPLTRWTSGSTHRDLDLCSKELGEMSYDVETIEFVDHRILFCVHTTTLKHTNYIFAYRTQQSTPIAAFNVETWTFEAGSSPAIAENRISELWENAWNYVQYLHTTREWNNLLWFMVNNKLKQALQANMKHLFENQRWSRPSTSMLEIIKQLPELKKGRKRTR